MRQSNRIYECILSELFCQYSFKNPKKCVIMFFNVPATFEHCDWLR